jgi:hypothetical protein
MSWERAYHSLWQPYNNHLFPLFRVLTWAVVVSAGRLSDVPACLLFAWMVGLMVALLAVYEFVSRETRSAVPGLSAVLLSGMTTSYYLGPGLYATTQIFWAITFSLMALLFLQSMRDGFRWSALLGATVMAMLAPAWRAEGLLAGPIASLYAVFGAFHVLGTRRRVCMALGPLSGTGLFVVGGLWICGQALLRSPGAVWDSPLVGFHPLRGAYLAARMSTEHFFFRSLSFVNELRAEQFLVLFFILTMLCVYWLQRSRFSALAICGLSLVLFSYLLVYTIRGNVRLEGVRLSVWYLMIPQFGWAIFLSAGLDPHSRLRGRAMTVADGVYVTLLGLGLYLLHHPLAVKLNEPGLHSHQRDDLARLERMEKLSQQEGIDVESIRQAIGPLLISGTPCDGLRLISSPPASSVCAASRVCDVAEVRRLFQIVESTATAEASGASVSASDRTKRSIPQ